jgi:hypothetical protein
MFSKTVITKALLIGGLVLGIAFSIASAVPAAVTAAGPDPKPEACAGCHPEPYKELKLTKHITALKSVQDQAGKAECLPCHSTDYLLAPTDKKPSTQGAKLGVTCTACHFDHQAGEGIDERRPPVCEDCHSGGKMRIGEAPHHPQKEMMLGTSPAETGVAKMPSMFGKKDCNGCHMPRINDKVDHEFSVLMPDRKTLSCASEGCHAGKHDKYEAMVKDWQAQTTKALTEVKGLLDAKKAKAGTTEYKVALFNYEFVETDHSKGVHNFPFAKKLLEVAKAKLASL